MINGYYIAVGLMVLQIMNLLLMNYYFHMCQIGLSHCRTLAYTFFFGSCEMISVGVHVRSGLIAAIYRKSLRLSPAGKNQHTTGEIVNMMSVDAQKMNDLASYLHYAWSCVLQIVLAVGFMFYFIGPATFAGFVCNIRSQLYVPKSE